MTSKAQGWRCDVCGEVYEDILDAEYCEERHQIRSEREEQPQSTGGTA